MLKKDTRAVFNNTIIIHFNLIKCKNNAAYVNIKTIFNLNYNDSKPPRDDGDGGEVQPADC